MIVYLWFTVALGFRIFKIANSVSPQSEYLFSGHVIVFF